jgi:hypothetical protein
MSNAVNNECCGGRRNAGRKPAMRQVARDRLSLDSAKLIDVSLYLSLDCRAAHGHGAELKHSRSHRMAQLENHSQRFVAVQVLFHFLVEFIHAAPYHGDEEILDCAEVVMHDLAFKTKILREASRRDGRAPLVVNKTSC